jgi:ankyrin repeat protein
MRVRRPWPAQPLSVHAAFSTTKLPATLRHDGGGVAIIDTSYQRGIEFLLKTLAVDGSWHVTSRLHPPAPVSPPYFDAGYPNGHDQFLSMQGASWAVMALSYALEPARPVEPPSLPGTEPANVEPWVETMIFGTRDDVRKLLDGGLHPNAATKSGGTTALMMAAPDVDKMTLLLDRGADVNARANSRYSALMVAAQYQEADPAINLLLDRGAQVAPPAAGAPVFDANPFFLASCAGNAKSLKRLLAAGGKLDEAMIAIGTPRTTPMLDAFKFGDIEVARTLLDLGAPVDFADGNGISMLGRAALNNDIEMARLLISRGAAVNVVDKLGMTPLLWAANIDFGDAAMIELLLQSGANAGVRTKDGLTPSSSPRSSATRI